MPWKEHDHFSKTIDAFRNAIKRGVLAKQAHGTITRALARRLKRVCDDDPDGLLRHLSSPGVAPGDVLPILERAC
jgi:hypothetical protein